MYQGTPSGGISSPAAARGVVDLSQEIVLVVEDEKMQRDQWGARFLAAGVKPENLVLTDNLQDAREAVVNCGLAGKPFTLVVTDKDYLDRSGGVVVADRGIELLKSVKRSPAVKLMFTAVDDRDVISQVESLGAKVHIKGRSIKECMGDVTNAVAARNEAQAAAKNM